MVLLKTVPRIQKMIGSFRVSSTISSNTLNVTWYEFEMDFNAILVIVGSVLGGLVIVVIVAYIIGRRKHSNDYESANWKSNG